MYSFGCDLIMSSIVDICAGPSVLDVFNTLLRHLRISVDSAPTEGPKAVDERNFQEAIVNTIGLKNYYSHKLIFVHTDF